MHAPKGACGICRTSRSVDPALAALRRWRPARHVVQTLCQASAVLWCNKWLFGRMPSSMAMFLASCLLTHASMLASSGGACESRGPFLNMLSGESDPGSSAPPLGSAGTTGSGMGMGAAGAGGASGGTYELETECFGNNLAGCPLRLGPGENMNVSENPCCTSSCCSRSSSDCRPQPHESGDEQHAKHRVRTGSLSRRSGVREAILQGKNLNKPS